MDLQEAIVGVVVAGLSALTTLIVTRRPAKVTAEAAWQAQMTAGFTALTAAQDKANAALHKEVEDLHETVRQQSAKIGYLSGVVTELSAHIEVLETSMKSAGHEVPARPRSGLPGLFVLDGGKS